LDWTSPVGIIRPEEYEALKQLFAATHGKLWNRQDRWGVGDPCDTDNQWFGLGCFNPCDAAIDGDACALARLQTIALPANNLYGTIPPSLFTAMRNLTAFDLSHNELSGSVPTTIGLLRNVDEVLLDHNLLRGHAPTELGLLGRRSTSKLSLAVNLISGQLPTELGLLSRVECVHCR
jgi:hypothetical protein